MMETERLLIRKFTPDDGDDLYEYLSLSRTYDFEPGEPVSRETAQELARERSGGDNFYAVELKESRKMIGHLYFSRTGREDLNTWELGYIFNPEYQNRGFGSESASRLLEYAFVEMKIHRIIAKCDPKNPASWKLLERIGMKREGMWVKNVFFKTTADGKPVWKDTYFYGLVNPGAW